MLCKFKFKSKATGDLIMLEQHGDNLARIPEVMAACDHVGFHVVPDAGHWVQYERPEAFNAVALKCLG